MATKSRILKASAVLICCLFVSLTATYQLHARHLIHLPGFIYRTDYTFVPDGTRNVGVVSLELDVNTEFLGWNRVRGAKIGEGRGPYHIVLWVKDPEETMTLCRIHSAKLNAEGRDSIPLNFVSKSGFRPIPESPGYPRSYTLIHAYIDPPVHLEPQDDPVLLEMDVTVEKPTGATREILVFELQYFVEKWSSL